MEVDGSDDFRFQCGDFQVAEPFACAGGVSFHPLRGHQNAELFHL